MPTALTDYEVTTTRQRLFDSRTDNGRCQKFFVGCRADSSFGVQINIPGLHASDEWLGLPPGSQQEFELPHLRKVNGITDVFARGDGGTAVIDCGVIGKLVT